MIKDVYCAVCKSSNLVDIGKNLILCKFCKTVINENYQELEYSDSYFKDEYKEQYGKTYLEDFENIYNASKKRIDKIFRKFLIEDRSNLKLLDIGSAMGFFLKAAVDSQIGFVQGVEISKYASTYCKEELKIDVITSSFDEVDISKTYDIITAWYFLEHSKDTLKTIKKISKMLNENGILAFSVPSSYGPLFKFNRKKWIEIHPVDHSIDFSPYSIKYFLKKIGFSDISVYPAAIHPERVMNPKSPFFKYFKPLYNIYSRLFSFSDTIEVYAKK